MRRLARRLSKPVRPPMEDEQNTDESGNLGDSPYPHSAAGSIVLKSGRELMAGFWSCAALPLSDSKSSLKLGLNSPRTIFSFYLLRK